MQRCRESSAATANRCAALVLAAVAYIPALLSAPGRMPADTKLYLYLDPGELVTKAPEAWDASQFGGWVPHQMIQYLWPAGPWYWACEHLGVPDWIAHRLWIGSLLFLAGFGVWRFARAIAMPVAAAAVTALVYQLSPYLLPYISRTSVMLLPWAALGWLLVLTRRALHEGGWRAPAMIALVVATAAGVNATAFAVILPAPMLWVLLEWRAGRVTSRRVVTATARIGALSLLASLWWVTMLWLQGSYGADVLGYSETLDSVAYTANSMEILRGLGYWLFYVKDPYAPATTSALPYQHSVALILVGVALFVICLLGLAVTRFAHRRFAVLSVVVGVVVAIGVHPYSDPSPAAGALRSSGLALALRSSTRAVPLVALGLGLGAGALVVAMQRHRRRTGTHLLILVIALIAANLPSLWTADLVDPAIARDEQPPSAWIEAATALESSDPSARVLQLPGAEFGAFRWGYTVDPPLPGLSDKPLLTRDLLPLGSAQMMDLLFALDDRVQSGQLDSEVLAPVARLLAADRIWVPGDMSFERFRAIRPEIAADLLATPVTGLAPGDSYGSAFVNTADIPMLDEDSLGDPRVGSPVAPVTLISVEDATRLARAATQVIVVDGSGDGVVDAAGAGLIYGDEAVRYANDLTPKDWQQLPAGTVVIVTDSNRDRDRQWRGSQDTTGFTESGGPDRDGQADSTAAVRLPLFETDEADGQTVATLEGALTAQASAYGDPFASMPEYRAAMAVDGDTTTGWRVGMRWAPIGEHFDLTGVSTTNLHLLQLQGDQFRKMITGVDIDVDGEVRHVVLDDRSLAGEGQPVEIGPASEVSIRITDVAARPGAPKYGEDWVGFAEVGPVAQEWVRPPMTGLLQSTPDTPLALVLRRENARPTDRWRQDPEPVLARMFDLSRPLAGSVTLQLRLAERSSDAALDALEGVSLAPTASQRLTGVPAARGSAAFDGDPDTSWTTPFDIVIGSSLSVPLQPNSTLSSLRLLQKLDDEHSPITELVVGDGSTSSVVTVPPPDADGYSTVTFEAITTDTLHIGIAAVEQRTTTERRLGGESLLPSSVSEIRGLPTRIDLSAPASCRDDLLTIDGRPLPVKVDYEALLRGELVDATPCAGAQINLAVGGHRILSADGRSSGIDVESVTIFESGATAVAHSAPSVTIESLSDTSARLTVDACPQGCWLIFGEGQDAGWEAMLDGSALGESVPVSGGSNGWFLPPSNSAREVVIEFAPQRTLDLAIWVSAAAVVACLAVICRPLLRRRPRTRPAPTADLPPSPEPPTLATPWQRVEPRTARIAGGLLIATCTVLLSPWWGVAAVLVAVPIVRQRQVRLAGLVAALGAGALGLLVAGVTIVRHTPAGMAWVGQLEPIHRCGAFLVLLLGCTAVLSDRSSEAPAASGPDAQNP